MTHTANILLVDDEPGMLRYIRTLLEVDEYKVETASTGEEALERVQKGLQPDLVLLDLLMPGIDGLQTLEQLRQIRPGTKVVMLSCVSDTRKVVQAIRLGAHDYLTKPFSLTVLLARLRAISRRAAQPSMPTLHIDDLVLDPASREVTRGGQKINLTATEFRVLEFLLRRAGRAASRSSIIEAVWGFEEEIESNTVDAYIKLLRDKIDNKRERKLIQTVRGYGYILREEV